MKSSRKPPLVIDVPAAVYRLAEQLGVEPQKLANDILMAGIRAMDNALAGGPTVDLDFNPPFFEAKVAEFNLEHDLTITGIIDRMNPEKLEGSKMEARASNQTLQEIVRERAVFGVNLTPFMPPSSAAP